MKVDQIDFGAPLDIEVVPENGEPFGAGLMESKPLEIRKESIGLIRLVMTQEDHWPIKARNPELQPDLEGLARKHMQNCAVCWVCWTDQNTAILTARIFEDGERRGTSNPLMVVASEEVVSSIRHRLSRSKNGSDVHAWLDDQFVVRDGRTVAIGVGVATDDDWRLFGRDFDAQLDPSDGRLIQVFDGKRADQREGKSVRLICGDISVRPAGGANAGSAVSTAVVPKNAGSYLGVWKAYLDEDRRRAAKRLREFDALHYSGCRRAKDEGWVFTFKDGPSPGAENALTANAGNLALAISEIKPAWIDDESADPFESVKRQQASSSWEFVKADFDQDDCFELTLIPRDTATPPTKGWVFMSPSSDGSRLTRQKHAIDLVIAGASPIRSLNGLIEMESSQIGQTTLSVPPLILGGPSRAEIQRAWQSVAGGLETVSRLSPNQVEAVQLALSTPDLALIQGPPGTGKSTIIAVIQQVLADRKEGWTLITSAQHDAVAHVAGKIVVNGLPTPKIGKRWQAGPNPDDVEDAWDVWLDGLLAEIRRDVDKSDSLQVIRLLRDLEGLRFDNDFDPISEDALIVRLTELQSRIRRCGLPGALYERYELAIEHLNRTRPITMDSGARDPLVRLLSELPRLPVAPRVLCAWARRFEEEVKLAGIRAALDWWLTREEFEAARDEGSAPESKDSPDIVRWRDDLVVRLLQAKSPPARRPSIVALLDDSIALTSERARKLHPKETALASYLEELEGDREGAKRAGRSYASTLAATLQQSDSKDMRSHLGKDPWSSTWEFDNVIVDEAARANPLDLLIAMAHAGRRTVLVGDHRQLPQMVDSEIEEYFEKEGLSETDALKKSLFERLFKTLPRDGERQRVITLRQQFRMHPALGAFVSHAFYPPDETFLSPRSSAEFDHGLTIPGLEDRYAKWIDVGPNEGRESRKGSSWKRDAEARAVADLVRRVLSDPNGKHLTIGVISFYAAQVDMILGQLAAKGIGEDDIVVRRAGNFAIGDEFRSRIRIGTVDSFQGRDFDLVILSVTRSNDHTADDEKSARKKWGFLTLESRLCVAMSRQKRILICVGDKRMAEGDDAKMHVRGLYEFLRLSKDGVGNA